jgi:hypothetical protein
MMVLELVIKMLGLGKRYFKDFYNIIDIVLVVVGLFELLYLLLTRPADEKMAMYLRSVRILRVIKVAK